MSETETDIMHNRLIHGTGFFDNGSSESDWADGAGRHTQTYISSSSPGHRDRPYDMSSDGKSAPRGRSRHRSATTALSNVTSLPIDSSDYSGANEEYSAGVVEDDGSTSQARRMSLTRLNKENIRLVDTKSIRSSIDSPRHSLLSGYNSLPTSPAHSTLAHATLCPAHATLVSPEWKHAEDTLTPLPQSPTFRSGYHQRSVSDSNSSPDSVLADSIIDAHVHTMRALEALGSDARGSGEKERAATGRSYLNSGTTASWPKSTTSFSENRRVALSPLSTRRRGGRHDAARREGRDGGDERGAAAAVAPPDPFATPLAAPTSLEFPEQSYHERSGAFPNFSLSASERSTEEYDRLDSACSSGFPEEVARYLPDKPETAYDDRKGKYVLGLVAAGGEGVDVRGRRERNGSTHGLMGSRDEERGGAGRKGNVREETERVVVWVGVWRGTWGVCGDVERGRGGDGGGQGRFEMIGIPTMLPLGSIHDDGDVDNEKQLHRHGYPSRNNSNVDADVDIDFDDTAFAKRLRAANHRLVGHWFRFSARTLTSIQLARRHVSRIDVHANDGEIQNITTTPTSTRQRGTPEKSSPCTSPPLHPSGTYLLALYKNPACGRDKHTVVSWARHVASLLPPPPSSSSSKQTMRYTIIERNRHAPTLQLVYTVSPRRILLAMAVLLSLSIAAALGWVFLGGGVEEGARQRVGSGMAVGVLVLLVEGCRFGGWVAFS